MDDTINQIVWFGPTGYPSDHLPLRCLAHGVGYDVGKYCPYCKPERLIATWPQVDHSSTGVPLVEPQ